MQTVSVVLPTRNRADMLQESVDSVLAQTHRAWELIIVNDASNEETSQRIAELADRDDRISLVSNTFQEGVAASLNKGFAKATGDLHTWTSDDNLYRPQAFEVMAKMLVGHDIVYTDMTLIDDMGLVIGHTRAHSPQELLLRNVVGSCFLYTRAMAQRVGAYDTHLRLVEDWDYWIRAAKAGFRFKAVPDDLYECRMHMGSLLEQIRPELNVNVEAMLHKHLGSLPEPHQSACLLHLALIEWGRGHKKQAKQLGRKAFGMTSLKYFKRELSDAVFGPGTSDKWTKTQSPR